MTDCPAHLYFSITKKIEIRTVVFHVRLFKLLQPNVIPPKAPFFCNLLKIHRKKKKNQQKEEAEEEEAESAAEEEEIGLKSICNK